MICGFCVYVPFYFCALMCIFVLIVDTGWSFSSIDNEVFCIAFQMNRKNNGLDRDWDLSLVILLSHDSSFLYKLNGINKKKNSRCLLDPILGLGKDRCSGLGHQFDGRATL